MGEILHPGSGFYHSGVALTVLRPGFVLKVSVGLKSISWSGYFRYTWLSVSFLSSFGGSYAGQVPDPSSFLIRPVKLNNEPSHTVVWISLMNRFKLSYGQFIPFNLLSRLSVKTGAGYPQDGGKVSPPSWFDYFQDG